MQKLNAVELVIADIEALAKNRGLYLYRYQTNHGNYRSTITLCYHLYPAQRSCAPASLGPLRWRLGSA